MTAHVVYEAIDPTGPATTSGKVVSEIIRGEIGFEGLLISDDTSMKALSGILLRKRQQSLPPASISFFTAMASWTRWPASHRARTRLRQVNWCGPTGPSAGP